MEESLNLKLPAVRAARPDSAVRWMLLGTGAAAIAVLFAVWPYQSWQYGERLSVLLGWIRIVQVGQQEWMFCLLVPLIVAALVYLERDRLEGLPLSGSWIGLAWLALGGLFYWLGYKVDTGYFGYAAIQCYLAGLILLLAGRRWMRALFFPWLFLFFSWPLFFLDQVLAGHLIIPTASAARVLLRCLEVETVQEGSVLQSAADAATLLARGAKFRLEVSDSCSGMRSLYALIMVSVLYGHLALRRTFPKLLLFASAIPFAVTGNVVRLLMLAFGSLWFGQKFAIGSTVNGKLEESTYHISCGLAVFAVALAGMFGLATLLEGKHWNRIRLGATASTAGRGSEETPKGLSPALVWVRSGTALGMSLAAILACWATPKKVVFAEPGLKLALPETVNRYEGEHRDMTVKEQEVFDTGVKLDRRVYRSPEGWVILGTLVLSSEAKKSLHTPEVCLPNEGWMKLGSEDLPISLEDGRQITVNLMRVYRDLRDDKGNSIRSRGLLMNWYIGANGVSTPSYFMSNFITYRDSIFRNLNHRWGQASFFTAYREQADAKTQASLETKAVEELRRFVSVAAPQFLAPRG